MKILSLTIKTDTKMTKKLPIRRAKDGTYMALVVFPSFDKDEQMYTTVIKYDDQIISVKMEDFAARKAMGNLHYLNDLRYNTKITVNEGVIVDVGLILKNKS